LNIQWAVSGFETVSAALLSLRLVPKVLRTRRSVLQPVTPSSHFTGLENSPQIWAPSER